MKKHLLVFGSLLSFGMLFNACNKDDDDDSNEEELITTVIVSVREEGSATVKNFIFRDLDGPGGVAPTLDSIILDASKRYDVALQFLNESESPAEDVTAEIRAEDEDHQVYFENTGVGIGFSGFDLDSNGLPLGLSSKWAAGIPAKGTVRITLKHKPGIKALGDPVSKGDTDIEIDFGTRLK